MFLTKFEHMNILIREKRKSGVYMEINNYKEIQKVNLIVISLNILVSLSKLIVGILINSVSMTADGFHSLGDGLNNVVGMVGIYFAYQPVDEKYPYGHRKFETMTTLLISGFLLLTSYSLLKSAYNRIIYPKIPIVTPISFLIMIFSIVVNIFVTKYERKKGQELNSDFLIADATHTLSDVYVSVCVLITFIAIKFNLLWVDIFISIIIAFIIGKSSIDIIKFSTNILCDGMAIDPKIVEDIVCEFEEIHSCYKIRSRGHNDDIYLDLHVIVSKDMSLDSAHTLTHNIEDYLKSRYPGIKDVYLHIEPPSYYMNEQISKV